MTPIPKRAEHVRGIALESVLRLAGAQPDPHDRHKWHTAQGVLSVTGSKFINWNRGAGGGGAIDLVIHLHQCRFIDALHWLETHFQAAASPPADSSATRPPLQLPIPVPRNLGHIKTYLAIQRSLPPALIDPLMGCGLIYADARTNAVFLLLGKECQPVGAELRGTCLRQGFGRQATPSSWRGMAPGSRKDLGCFSIGPDTSSRLILCESAIDAISCAALHPQTRCLSTAGARTNPQWLAALIEQHREIYCGYDADPVGDAMALAMQARHPAVKRLRPCAKDWNDVLRRR
jgi:hypothetical protein